MQELLDATPSRKRDLVTAMLVAQVIAPGSKLATARGLRTQTATSSLGQVLGVTGCDEDDLYAAMDWALQRKDAIENALAARHLANGTLVLYDVSSAAFEGRTCPLGAIGHPKDGVKGRLQIVYGLLCSTDGIPNAIEGFEACSPTLASATSYARRSWTGSARCAPRRSRPWSRRARCSCRCSMSRTSSRSAPRSFPASGWCAATTPSWPRNGPANAASCWPPPKKNSSPSRPPPAATSARCAARTRSRCGWARWSTTTRWPNTSPSRSPTSPSPSPATPKPSPLRPPSTGSTCCAPACPNRPSPSTTWWSATRTLPTSSGSSAPSTPN